MRDRALASGLAAVAGWFLIACAGPQGDGRKPVAVIVQPNTWLYAGDALGVSSMESYDPDNYDPRTGGIERVRWSMLEQPAGSSAAPLLDDTPLSVFQLDEPGFYTIALDVTDFDGLESRATLEVEAVAANSEPRAAIEFTWEWERDGYTAIGLHVLNATEGTGKFGDLYDCDYSCSPDWGPEGPEGDPEYVLYPITYTGPELIRIREPTTEVVAYKVAVRDDYAVPPNSPDFHDPIEGVLQVKLGGLVLYEDTHTFSYTGQVWEAAVFDWPRTTVHPLDIEYRVD